MSDSNRYKDLVAGLTSEETEAVEPAPETKPKRAKKSKARTKKKPPTARSKDDPKMARLSKGILLAKSKNPDYEKGTYYLPKSLTRKMRIHASIKQIEMSDLVATAVTQYLVNNPVDLDESY